jgi:hypothetical protein
LPRSPIPRAAFTAANAPRHLAGETVALPMSPEAVRPDVIASRLSLDAVNQGPLAEVEPLPSPRSRISTAPSGGRQHHTAQVDS